MTFGFRAKKIAGVDISDSSIKIIRLERERGEVVLKGSADLNLKKGWVQEGIILQPDKVADLLKKAFQEIPGLRGSKWVVASLPEEKSFFEILALPLGLKKEEIVLAARSEAEKYIPLPLEEVYLDIEPVEESSKHLHVALGAIPREVADSYLKTFKKAGLEPVFFEIETQAIARAVIKEEYAPSPVIILDFGAARTKFVIFSGRYIRFSSSVPFAGDLFSKEIAKRLGISLERAEKIKQERGLEAEKEVMKIIEPHLQNLVNKIKEYVAYYITHPTHEHKEVSLDTILLCGGFANLKGLPEFLEKALGMRVVLANPWVNILGARVKRRPEITLRESLKFTTALGLAQLALNLEF